MAEQAAPPIPHQHNKGNVALCEPLPLPLSLRGRVRAGVGRRLDTPSPASLPLPIEFVDVSASLPPSSLCAPASDERARGRVSGASGGECHDRGHIQGSDGVPVPHQQVLAGQTEGALVLGSEDLPRCVVVDLQGNVVVQETPPPPTHTTTTTTTPTPYLVDQPILVQVGPDVAQQAQTHSNGALAGPLEDTPSKPPTGKNGMDGSDNQRVVEQTGGRKAEFGPRWTFKEVDVKEERGVKDTNASEESTGEESEAEAGRPRRKSAKRARQRWKTIGEVEGGRGGVGRVRRPHQGPPPRDRSQVKADDGEQRPWVGDAGEELPVWARHLSSVRVVDGQWVVGVASTSEVLQQTLEAHSRSVLCDYIKSHPSSLEQRHRAKCQASRIMWHHQRIRFDGVPFTILSSNDLKCAFAMNYKLKRKNKGSGGNQQRKGQVEGVEFGMEGRIGGDGGDVEDLQGSGEAGQAGDKDVVPKKKYKDIWFTSCPARITVKVIMKYPGYAVGIGALAGERKAVMKALRRDLAQGTSPQREELYHVTLPLRRLHNHPLQGRSRGIHPSIDGKVVSLLREGVTAPKAIQQLLERHVEAVTAGDLVLPHPDDRAFHPRLKDVANLVYTRCRQMGITARRRPPDQASFEAPHKKRRRPKRPREDGEMDGEAEVGCGEPLGASTLQEAVQTFCTEESERGSDGGVGEAQGDRADVGLAEMVRGQLDTLRGLTYTTQDTAALQEVYQGLQALINQYMAPTGPALTGGGLAEVPSATATFILQDSGVDPMAITSGTPCVAEVPDTLALQEKDMGEAGKVRGSAALRQLRPPVALQCVTTSMVPTVVSQLPRAPNHAPPAHVVTSPAAPAPPTYQTLAPVAQDGPPPVHLSLPPYFYYVQEVTVPETSQTWTYSTSS